MRVMWPRFLAAVLSVCGYCLYVRRIEKRPVAELSRVGAWREVAAGVLGSSVLLALTMGILFAYGGYRVTGSGNWTVLSSRLRNWSSSRSLKS